MYPENSEGTHVIIGSMNMGYISDTARNRTHNLLRPMYESIPLGHIDKLYWFRRPHGTVENHAVPCYLFLHLSIYGNMLYAATKLRKLALRAFIYTGLGSMPWGTVEKKHVVQLPCSHLLHLSGKSRNRHFISVCSILFGPFRRLYLPSNPVLRSRVNILMHTFSIPYEYVFFTYSLLFLSIGRL